MVSPVTGCKSKDSTLVKVLSPIKIPNVFTPNGDKLNDVWEIENIDNFPDNVVRVFNRWGNVVYEKGGYTNATGWNGTTSSGGELPVAVYYFVIDPKHPKGGGVHAGYVTVLK